MTEIKTYGYTVDIKYLGDTSRGISYEGKIYKNKELVGFYNNDGNGGITTVDILPEKRNEVKSDILVYLKQFEYGKELVLEEIDYSSYYTFVENLIDILEDVQDNPIKGFYV